MKYPEEHKKEETAGGIGNLLQLFIELSVQTLSAKNKIVNIVK